MVSEYICLITGLISLIAKLKCRLSSVSAVVAPKKSGKTELIKQLDHKNFILLDIESSIRLEMTNDELQKLNTLEQNFEQTSFNSFYYPLCAKYFKKIRKDFKKKSIIIFSSDPELVKYLGIKNVLYLTPSNKLFSQILEKYQDESTRRLLQSSRDSIISVAGKKLQAFGSYEQLLTMVVDKFNLKPRL